MKEETDISIIIPAYNEQENVSLLYKELKIVLENINKSFELIFVDDGSTDKTLENLKYLHEKDSRVKIIVFEKNFKKSAALSAGFNEAKGRIVFTMDADLQDDPKEIPKFLKKLDEGYDLVSGWKFKRFDPITKTLPSKFFNFLTRKMTGVNIHDSNCGFKAYKQRVIKNVSVYGELHRYIPALSNWKGFKVGEIKVCHRPRKFGKSKYGTKRLVSGFLDLITVKFLTEFDKKPLHFFGSIGLISGFAGFLMLLYLFILKLFLSKSIGQRPLLLLGILLVILSVQFFSLGLLGEMVTFNSKKENYIIKETIQ
ncbi:MAG: glycosyltransferase family 2 protein [Nanoarchaeota archaeon]|nr:glycosyltransferase family 2 protein [Nanoarchaeota archaeon]